MNLNFDENDVCHWLTSYQFLQNAKFLNFQRDIDWSRVEKIFTSYENDLNKNNRFIVFGTILLGLIDNDLYLLDGQHRFCAIQKIYKKYGYSSNVHTLIYRCKTSEQLFDYFKKINCNEIVAEWNLSNINYVNLIKQTIEKLCVLYPNYVSKKTTVIPRINLSDFFDLVVNYRLMYCYKLYTVDDILQFINKLNNNILKSLHKHKNILKISKRLEYFEKKNDDKQLYLSAITIKGWNHIFLNNINIDEDVLINV